MNNGHRSDFFTPTRGFKQGDPVSSLGFNLIVEVIACKIRQNKEIKGVTVNGVRKALGQFANDMWTISEFDEKSYCTTLRLFKSFEEFSGLAINYNKTEVLRIGSLRKSDAKFVSDLPIIWSEGPLKILGISIYPTISETAISNYETIMQSTKKIIDTWSVRDLTLYGKIQNCNTLLITQAIYKLQVLPSPPKEYIKQYKKMIREFIWNQKTPKISYDKMIQKHHNGGLALQDLAIKDQAIKANIYYEIIIQNATETNNNFLTKIVKRLLPIKYQHHITNLKVKDVQKLCIKKTSFWEDYLMAWSKFSFNVPTSQQDILEQPLSYNSNIKIDNKMLIENKLYTKGAVVVGDLLDKQNKIYDSNTFTRTYSTDFLTYQRIKKAIPQVWQKNLSMKNPPSVTNPSGLEKIWGKRKKEANIEVTNIVYTDILHRINIDNSKLILKWEEEVQRGIYDTIWSNIMIDTFQLTSCAH